MSINTGIVGFMKSGSMLRWAWRYHFGDLYRAPTEDVRRVIPSDFKSTYNLRKHYDAPDYHQWTFEGPDGINVLRIHENIYDRSQPWQVRWGVKDVGQIPPEYQQFLSEPNRFDPHRYLYFDRFGKPQHWRSTKVHEEFIVDVTYEQMVKFFGK
jgi:hypothetical protein